MAQNQCDGCMAMLPLIGGTHVDSTGNPVMVCQRGRYNEGEYSQKPKNPYFVKLMRLYKSLKHT